MSNRWVARDEVTAFTGSDYGPPFGEASCRIRGHFLSLEGRQKEVSKIFSSIVADNGRLGRLILHATDASTFALFVP